MFDQIFKSHVGILRYFKKFHQLYLDETRVISESRDSAGLNDIGGGGFGSNTKSTRFDWSEFFLLFR